MFVAQIELSQIVCSICQTEQDICDTQILFAKHGHASNRGFGGFQELLYYDVPT